MNNSQRRILLVFSIILASLFGLAGWFGEMAMMFLFGPPVSIAIGLFVWAGRDKTEKPPASEC